MAVSGVGDVETLKVLSEMGGDINAQAKNGRTLLHMVACRNGGVEELIKVLVEMGANVHAQDEDRGTPLQLAERHGFEAQ
jgi:ankyrin repeat protein